MAEKLEDHDFNQELEVVEDWYGLTDEGKFISMERPQESKGAQRRTSASSLCEKDQLSFVEDWFDFEDKFTPIEKLQDSKGDQQRTSASPGCERDQLSFVKDWYYFEDKFTPIERLQDIKGDQRLTFASSGCERDPRLASVSATGRFKTKALSIFNNLQNSSLFQAKGTNLDLEVPTWLLGRLYHAEPRQDPKKPEHVREFLSYFYSLFWITYRQGFPPMGGRISDCGWGCMLRTGQMILAEALKRHILGRDWRCVANSTKNLNEEREILRWF